MKYRSFELVEPVNRRLPVSRSVARSQISRIYHRTINVIMARVDNNSQNRHTEPEEKYRDNKKWMDIKAPLHNELHLHLHKNSTEAGSNTRPHVLCEPYLYSIKRAQKCNEADSQYNEIVSADLLLLELRISFSIVLCFLWVALCGSPPSRLLECKIREFIRRYLPSENVKVCGMTGKI